MVTSRNEVVRKLYMYKHVNLNIDDLSTVREFFSHRLRTSTALLVATATVIKHGFIDDILNIEESIAEAAFFVDVYESGMNTCFDYCLNKNLRANPEKVMPSDIIKHVLSRVEFTITDATSQIECDLDDFSYEAVLYPIKALLEVVLCEELRAQAQHYKITGKDGLYTIVKDKKVVALPEIYPTLRKVFKAHNVEFTYDDTNITLRFLA